MISNYYVNSEHISCELRVYIDDVACKALPLVGEWDRPFHNGINKNAC